MNDGHKIGLALGSGGARGLAHIGVLKALEEHDIKIDMISGCSAGALVGGLYCCGISPKMIADIAFQLDMKTWVDLTVPKKGFIKGEKIQEIVKLLTRCRNIEDLKIPFTAISTDLKVGQRYIFNKGPLYRAIRASISVPGVFEPLRMGNKVLVDGAVIDRVPASVVKGMGSDIVIAVDVGFGAPQGKINHIIDVMLQSIDVMSRQISKRSFIKADILLEPSLTHIGGTKFNLVDECVEIGYNTTIEKIDEIKGLLNEKNYAI
ncbi:patatin-like phospholipase family protein [Sporosalibacterium faouarense]|uniref:patatin-like phospholipase family protein n=1 Tax=Sporosalibacterium faouarense TaxID=516123 RepID=UPI00141C2325|nr:patatin family protein [Bacillota bacterium]